MKRTSLAVAFACVVVGLVAISLAVDKPTQVTLKQRTGSGYEGSGYSFRKATTDAAVHRNYVDLVLNNCGSLHVRPVNEQENRIVDLGQLALADAPSEAPADAKWLTEKVKPLAGHVYLEEIKQHGQTMTVKFIVDEVKGDTVKLTWTTVIAMEGPDDSNRGAAGRMGHCGGAHNADE